MKKEKKELETYVSKIGNIKEKIRNVLVEVNVKNFSIYELEDTISIYMKVNDETGSINALLVTERNNEEIKKFINSLNTRKKFKDDINCKIYGGISIIDKEMYNELNDKKLNFENIEIGNKILIIKSIENIDSNYDTLFGKNILYLYDCKLKELYQLIKDNTNYLNNIEFDEIKDIQIVNNKNICVLLKNDIVQYNGKEYLNNIHCLWFNCGNVYAISNDKKIIAIECNNDIAKYLNNNNDKYKKIFINLIYMVALTNDGEIKIHGFLVDIAIDYKRLINVDDIGYDVEKKEVVVIQNNKIRSLFVSIIDKLYDKSKIILNGKNEEKSEYFEII